MKTILKLTEPNGNDVYINVDQLACMYRKVHKSGSDEREVTMLVIGGTMMPVTEMPDEIIDMIDRMMRAAGYASATISS